MTAPARVLAARSLPVLLLASGFCGISYEILYARLLGNLLGNPFAINATVLLAVLLGIGLGTLYAHRFAAWLWAVEAGIGLYALMLTGAYQQIDRLLYARLPWLGTSIETCALIAFALLAPPAFLIGCSIPMFASYLSSWRKDSAFSISYGLYNFGAALTALTMEFVLLRWLGLRWVTLALAVLNGLLALTLFMLLRWQIIRPALPASQRRFRLPILVALATASTASAIFQLLMLKLAEFIFGPFNETFALVLANVMLGLALGSYAAGRWQLSFNGALLLSLAGLVWILVALSPAVWVYAALYPWAVERTWTLVLLKWGLMWALMAPAATGFGATIPSLLERVGDVARESGQLLSCSSLANALGFLLMAFVLHRYLDYGPILVLLALLVTAALLLRARSGEGSSTMPLTLAALAVICQIGLWDEMLLYAGHTSFHSRERLQEQRQSRFSADRFKGPQDVFAITWKDGKPYFFINGYISIPLSSNAEKLVGALSAMLAPRLDQALVLGMGSGATAGAVALAFEHTDVVEINAVIIQNLQRMAQYNYDIEHRPNVRIIHDDGIHFVKVSPRRYSLILNTVNSPIYFSSSKLYTRDFFALVKRRLTPDGVYVTWLDWRIGDRGFDIILETLSREFRECWLSYMDTNYFVLACSQDGLGVRQLEAVQGQAELRQDFAQQYMLPLRLLPYSVILTRVLSLHGSGRAPLNTLDHPVLEFEMARLHKFTDLASFKKRLYRVLDLAELQAELGPLTGWEAGGFLLFADLRLERDSSLSRMFFDLATTQLGQPWAAYERQALACAGELGSAEAYQHYGNELRRRERYGAAAMAFGRALEIDPLLDDAHYDLGLCYASAADYQGAVRSFLEEWKMDRDSRVPLRLGRALLAQGRHAEALEWLQTARALETESADPRVLYYQAVAYEGLHELGKARQHYEQVLREDRGHQQAREALARLGPEPARSSQ